MRAVSSGGIKTDSQPDHSSEMRPADYPITTAKFFKRIQGAINIEQSMKFGSYEKGKRKLVILLLKAECTDKLRS